MDFGNCLNIRCNPCNSTDETEKVPNLAFWTEESLRLACMGIPADDVSPTSVRPQSYRC